MDVRTDTTTFCVGSAWFAERVQTATEESISALRRAWPGREITGVSFDPATIRPFDSGRVCWNGVATVDGVSLEVCAYTPPQSPFKIGMAALSVMCVAHVAGKPRMVNTAGELEAAHVAARLGL